jgi:hypothetical protein
MLGPSVQVMGTPKRLTSVYITNGSALEFVIATSGHLREAEMRRGESDGSCRDPIWSAASRSWYPENVTNMLRKPRTILSRVF